MTSSKMMEIQKIQKIKKIAHLVRKRIVKQNKNGMFPYDLCGLCAISSVELFIALRKAGFRIQVVKADGHAYVTWKNYIIDITATQFGQKNRVCIIPIQYARQKEKNYWWWKKGRASGNLTEIRRIFRSWQGQQNPFNTQFWNSFSKK